MNTFFQLYNLLKTDKKKERFDIILEPLQAVTQLALLSFSPKGSKLTISNNLLSIQPPSWIQGLMRSYNNDTKEDLFFLFNAIIRFNRFYIFLKSETDEYSDLFDLLIQLGKRGIDKLLQTYSNTDQPSLLHTLQLYRMLLDKPYIFNETDENENNNSNSNSNNNNNSNNVVINSNSNSNNSNSNVVTNISSNISANSIDNIFINIRELYSSHEFIILYQSLILLEKNQDKYDIYTKGINTIMTPSYEKIQKWIVDNIVY